MILLDFKYKPVRSPILWILYNWTKKKMVFNIYRKNNVLLLLSTSLI